MALPVLDPVSTVSSVILPSTGSHSDVNDGCSFKIYSDTASELYSTEFITGAVKQVTFVYHKLGGDVLDVELVPSNVYTAYEEAVVEYSYILNLHQSKNALSSMLGSATGTFDHEGQMVSGSALSGSDIALKYPKFTFSYSKHVFTATSNASQINFDTREYSASFNIVANQQDYDLQSIISASAATDSSLGFYGAVGNREIQITKVFYKTPIAMWRFYNYYGGLNVVGNLQSYGQFSDDTSFDVVPVWQNRLQAQAYEDALKVRYSDFSYELKHNMLRIYPKPSGVYPTKMWIRFIIPDNSWDSSNDGSNTSVSGSLVTTESVNGINNMNTLPFTNLPYQSINSIGKAWIRRYCLALCMEMLAQVRGKFATIPIPGNDVTLNAESLMQTAKEQQEKLREELKTILDEMTYAKLAEQEASITENAAKVAGTIPSPMGIYVG